MKSQNEVEAGGERQTVDSPTDQPATAAVPAPIAAAGGAPPPYALEAAEVVADWSTAGS